QTPWEVGDGAGDVLGGSNDAKIQGDVSNKGGGGESGIAGEDQPAAIYNDHHDDGYTQNLCQGRGKLALVEYAFGAAGKGGILIIEFFAHKALGIEGFYDADAGEGLFGGIEDFTEDD